MKAEYKFDFNFNLRLGSQLLKVQVKSNASTVALRAPSGSGKSSFLKAILGLNKKISEGSVHVIERVGYVPQDSLLIPHLTVKENLLLSPRANLGDFKKVTDQLLINNLLERYPRMLSGGEKQRVAIGRALLADPKALIFDEPFSALDLEMRGKIVEFLKAWLSYKNADLILVTHDEDSSNPLCEEVWSIQNNVLAVRNLSQQLTV